MTDIRQPHVLIVDDVPENLQLLSGMLKNENYLVRAVPGGRMAIESVNYEKPDIILLDINMPDLDGYEVCRILKSRRETRDIPVIFISAMTETIDKVRAFGSGGVDYITKPYQIDEVKARLETHLKISRLQKLLEAQNTNLESTVQNQVREIANAQLSTIMAIVKLSEARDDDTGHHIERTRSFCRLLAEYLFDNSIEMDTVDRRFINTIYIAAPLHDIGKIAIPDQILLKPGQLTREEFEIMKTHTVIGADNLKQVSKDYPKNEFINMGIEIALNHHERWDGKGYPNGLKEGNIPLAGRIMAIADVYDALRSERVYKEAYTHKYSSEIIIKGRGSHFDPRLIDAFEALEAEFESIRDNA